MPPKRPGTALRRRDTGVVNSANDINGNTVEDNGSANMNDTSLMIAMQSVLVTVNCRYFISAPCFMICTRAPGTGDGC